CVAKRQCFAPASLYRPFGRQAAGVRSLSQFQALQDGEQELVSLRELGLTDAEIQLWRSRGSGVSAAPDAKQQRLQVIRDKIEARAELLSRPQRFSASRPLSRREMEIEQALFQGNERLGFLTALYHRCEEGPLLEEQETEGQRRLHSLLLQQLHTGVDIDGDAEESQQGASSSDPMDSLYRDVLRCQKPVSPENPEGQQAVGSSSTSAAPSDQSQSAQSNSDQSKDSSRFGSDPQSDEPSDQQQNPQDRAETDPPAPPVRLDLNQPIGSLAGASGKPLTVSGEIKTLTDEEILKNRESDEGIRSIARFQSYQPGKPSKVLCVKNLSAQASIAQLVALFSRFEQKDGPPVVYRLLTGRMKGQAFITLSTETAHNALQLVHGYRLLGKPLVVEFGRERQEDE
uniref:RNA binding motif protein 41 n=1 Tax=Fundulus heteroclitus TaxID=8078 RepID=A0A3Q2NZQ3_FUNHE